MLCIMHWSFSFWRQLMSSSIACVAWVVNWPNLLHTRDCALSQRSVSLLIINKTQAPPHLHGQSLVSPAITTLWICTWGRKKTAGINWTPVVWHLLCVSSHVNSAAFPTVWMRTQGSEKSRMPLRFAQTWARKLRIKNRLVVSMTKVQNESLGHQWK